MSEVEVLDLKRSVTLLRDEKQRADQELIQIKREFEDEKAKSK